jgi:hypothetical protein
MMCVYIAYHSALYVMSCIFLAFDKNTEKTVYFFGALIAFYFMRFVWRLSDWLMRGYIYRVEFEKNGDDPDGIYTDFDDQFLRYKLEDLNYERMSEKSLRMPPKKSVDVHK